MYQRRLWLVIIILSLLMNGTKFVLAQDQNLLTRAPDSIIALQWSPNGQFLAQVIADGRVQVLDATSNQILAEFLPQNGLTLYQAQVDWSTNSDLLAAGVGQMIYIWNIRNNQLLKTLQAGGGSPFVTFEAGYSVPEGFVSLKWNSKSSMIMAESESSRLTIWSYPSGNLLLDQIIGNIPVPVVWLPDESGITNGDAIVDLKSNKFEALDSTRLPEAYNIGVVTSIAINFEHTQIVRGTVSGYIEVVDSITGDTISSYRVSNSLITSVAWNKDSTEILNTDRNGILRIADVVSGVTSEVLKSNAPILAADWSPFGGQIAVGTLPEATNQYISNSIMRFAFQNTGLDIVIPIPSPERLQTIAHTCNAPEAVLQTLPISNTVLQLSTFADRVNTLPQGTIPPACAADLLAVANALQSK